MATEMKPTNDPSKRIFFNIVPRAKTYMKYNISPIRLRVVRQDGVNYKPDIQIKVNKLNKGKKHFVNTSSENDEFSIKVLIHKDDKIMGFKEGNISLKKGVSTKSLRKKFNLIDTLDYWIRHMYVFAVTTDAIDIENGYYLITSNGTRKQTSDNYTLWDLTFTKYTGTTWYAMNYNNKNAKKAINSYKASVAKKKAKAKKATSSLKNCTYKNMVYSKTKKVNACNKILQTFLKKKGFYKAAIDGWYGTETYKAVYAFQKKYRTLYKLSVTGKVDAKTLNAMQTIEYYNTVSRGLTSGMNSIIKSSKVSVKK